MRRTLVTWAEAQPVDTQPTKACGDCPWRRDSLAGWLGEMSPEEWVKAALADGQIQCHALVGPDGPVHCAGAAIFRANLCKVPRDPDALRLPPDRKAVFAMPDEFRRHHDGRSTSAATVRRRRRSGRR